MTRLADVPEHLRVKLVHAVLDEVTAGRWSAHRAAEELSAFGFAASPEKVKAALSTADRAFESTGATDAAVWRDTHRILVSRLARPVGGLTSRNGFAMRDSDMTRLRFDVRSPS